jgi:hypothetical protein
LSKTQNVSDFGVLPFQYTAKKRLACTNVVENRPEQYFAAHIVPGSVNDIVQHCSAEQC